MTALKASLQANALNNLEATDSSDTSASVRMDRYLWQALVLFAFVIPIKLSWGYAVLIPLILSWVLIRASQGFSFGRSLSEHSVRPLFLWFLVGSAAAVFGIDPLRSLTALSTLTCSLTLVLVSKDLVQKNNSKLLITALILGQTVAALHTMLEPVLPVYLQHRLVGAVTESGQLALVLPIILGLLCTAFNDRLKDQSFTLGLRLNALSASVSVVSFTACGFLLRTSDSGSHLMPALLIVLPLVLLLLQIPRAENSIGRLWLFLLNICLPLLIAALIVNLKRGPWAGVLIAATVLLLQVRPRYVLPLFASLIIGASLISPVRERLLESYQNFAIAGGRQTMWQIGLELSAKYPLGIGFKNGEIISQLDPHIPHGYDHLHNNFLNILVETGWIGVMLFAWWILRMLRLGLIRSKSDSHLFDSNTAFCLGLGLLAWQVAGIVEYNFGDSEVLLIALLLCGALSGVRAQASAIPFTLKE